MIANAMLALRDIFLKAGILSSTESLKYGLNYNCE